MQVAAQKVNAIRGLGVQDAQRDKQSSTNGVAGVELRIGHDKNDEGADENLNADDECSRSPGDGQCHLAYVDHAAAVVNLAIVMVGG